VKNLTLYMIGNAHIDPVWLWQWSEGFHEVKATFRSALDLMKEFPEFIFTASSVAFYEWIEQTDSDMFAEIQQRVAEGRWSLVGGWWIEPDCNIPCGESFVRQGLYGQLYFMEKFGRIARVGYNVDSFGHHGMLPQLLKKCGLEYYVFMRPMPHEKELPGRLFWWQAADGSRLLTYRLPFDYSTWEGELEQHVQRCAQEIPLPFSQGLCFYGVGDHGGGPTRKNLETIRLLNQAGGQLQLRHSTLEAFFRQVEQHAETLPVVQNELQHHASGCYAAHSGVKRWNRRAENQLLMAEKYATIAEAVVGQPYPDDLSLAWKAVLFNQFHDVLAGTSLEAAYEDARNGYGQALAIADRALTFALQSLGWNIHIPLEDNVQPIVVFNPHAWSVRHPVEIEYRIKGAGVLLDEAGRVVPLQTLRSQVTTRWRGRLGFMAELPPLGYRVYRFVQPVEQPVDFPSLKAGEFYIENDALRLEIDPASGCIASLLDKRRQVEVFAGPAARPVVVADDSDTWSHGVFRFDHEIGEFTAPRVQLTEAGAVKATLRVTSHYHNSRLIQEFSLYALSDRVEVKVQVDWREQHKLLKLRFPVRVSQPSVFSEIPYGAIERLPNGDEEPMQAWVDLSGVLPETGEPYGLSLLNDGKYSYDARQNDLGLTALRSPIYAHHEPAEPDPDELYSYIDQGIQRFTYVLLPHSGSWTTARTVQEAVLLNQPPTAYAITFHPQGELPQVNSFLAVEPESILVNVLKKAEEGDDLILRAFNPFPEPKQAVFRLSFLNRSFEAVFGAYEIKTWRIPRRVSLPVSEVNLLEMTG